MIYLLNQRNPYSVRLRTVVKVDKSSVLGNKSWRGIESEREASCLKYDIWLKEKIKVGDRTVCDELNRLYLIAKKGNLYLACWCAPKQCHSESIKRVLEAKLHESRKNS